MQITSARPQDSRPMPVRSAGHGEVGDAFIPTGAPQAHWNWRQSTPAQAVVSGAASALGSVIGAVGGARAGFVAGGVLCAAASLAGCWDNSTFGDKAAAAAWGLSMGSAVGLIGGSSAVAGGVMSVLYGGLTGRALAVSEG